MICLECGFAYLEDKVAVMEGAIRRMVNVLTFSPLAQQKEDAKKAIITELGAFGERWKDQQCKHVIQREPESPITEFTAPKRKGWPKGKPRGKRCNADSVAVRRSDSNADNAR